MVYEPSMFQRSCLLILFLTFFSAGACLSLPCCGMEGPRILASLQDLRQLDFSFSTSFQEVYAKYDSEGKVSRIQGPSDLAFQLTSVARLTPDLELFGTLPFIFRGRTNLGNLQLGMRRMLLRNVYLEDPTPNISLVTALKIPTGLRDLSLTEEQMGWEPYLGLGLQKEFLTWWGSLDLGMAVRQKEILFKAAESASYSFFHPLSLGLGAQQLVSMNTDSRSLGLFSFLNWTVDQFTLLGAQVDWSLPLEGLGQNQPITRSASLSLRYTFY